MSNLATGYVQIIPSMQGSTKIIEGELNKAGDKAGASSGIAIGSSIKKAVAAAGIGTALTKTITEGANLEQAIGGIKTLYGKSAGTVIKYADEAWKTAGISANDYMEQSTSFAAALLNSLGGDTAKAAEAANTAILDMSDNANKMGTDIESIQMAYQGFAKQNYTMLDNLKLGYSGTKEGMQELLSHAETLPSAMGRKFDLSNLDDVYTAIHLVQNELGITGVAADEVKTTLSGSFGALKSSLSNLMGDLTLGRNIEPAMRALAESASTFLFNNLIPAIGNIFKSLPVAMGVFLNEGLPALGSAFSSFIKSFADSFKNSDSVLEDAFTALFDFAGMILDNIDIVIDAAIEIIKGLVKGLLKSVPVLLKAIPKLLKAIIKAIIKNTPILLKGGADVVKIIAKGMLKNTKFVITSIGKIIKALIKIWYAHSWIKLGVDLIKKIVSGIKKTAGQIIAKIKEIINKIKTRFTKVKWNSLGSSLVKKIGSGIKSAVSSVTSRIKSIIDSIKSKFKITNWASLGSSLMSKIAGAIKNKVSDITSPIKNAIDTIKGWFPISIGKILKNLKLPHFSITYGSKDLGKLGTIQYPKDFGVKWYAQGGIFTKPTIIGNAGFGDVNEAMVPLDPFWNKFDEKLAQMASGGGVVNLVLNLDGSMIAKTTIDYINGQTIRYNTNPLIG